MKALCCLIISCCILGSACRQQDGNSQWSQLNDGTRVVAHVGDLPVTEGDIDFYIKNLPEPYQKKAVSAYDRKRILNQLIFDRLLYLEGVARELDKQMDVRKDMRTCMYRAVAGPIMRELREEIYQVPPADLQAHYQEHKQDYRIPAQAHLRLIYLRGDDAQKLAEVKQSLAQGQAFSEVAKAYSADPSAEKGGDIGWVTADKLDARIAQKAFDDLAAGAVSEPVQVDKGWVIVKLIDKKDAHIPPLADLKTRVTNDVILKKRDMYVTRMQERMKILEDRLRNKFTVRYHNE